MRMKLKHRHLGPEPVHPTGQPSGPTVTITGPVGQGKQPGHKHVGDHPPTGVAKPDVSVVSSGPQPKTVKTRIHAPPSHHRMRTEGQVLHERGLKVTGGPSQGAFAKPGRIPKSPGHPEQAAQADVGGRSTPNMEHEGAQDRLKVGSAARFKRLKMTPKIGGGRY